MTLDAFIGKSTKKKTKKESTKSSKRQEETNEIEKKIEDKKPFESVIIEGESEKTYTLSKNMDSSQYKLIKINLICSSRCGFKKTLKKLKSFVPKEKDLICPKCGKKMKIEK